MCAAFPGISTWLIISRCWQIKLGQRRRKQSAWKLLIMRAKWEASWISKGGFMLQILRKSDCQQITLHRIPTIPPYGDAGGLWLQVGMKRWRGEEMHNWCTLEFGPEWWQTGSTWSNIRTHQGLCVSWYNTISLFKTTEIALAIPSVTLVQQQQQKKIPSVSSKSTESWHCIVEFMNK